MDDQNYKNLPTTKFDLHKVSKIHDFFKENRKLFCLFLFLFTIEIKDGGKAPIKPSNKYSKIQFNKENVPMGPSIGFYVM